jgi:tetratricopeptide (TPR) repeat protein
MAACSRFVIPLCLFAGIGCERTSDTYRNRGDAFLSKKKYGEAVRAYSFAIQLDPTDTACFHNRGAAYYGKAEYGKAIEDYSEAIRLNPKDEAGFNNRGMAYYEKNEYDKAIESYSAALRLNPNKYEVFSNRGVAYFGTKEYDKAIADFSETIRLSPNDAYAFRMRGLAHNRTRHYDQAIADYNEAIRLDPKNAYAFANLAALLATCPDADRRNGKRAVELATKACELSRLELAPTLVVLAAAYAECGDFEQAVNWQEKAIELGIKDKDKAQERLELYRSGKPYREE